MQLYNFAYEPDIFFRHIMKGIFSDLVRFETPTNA